MASNLAQGKTIVVTGAAGGLGKAIAAAFLKAGGNVAICNINQERLDQIQSEWKSQSDKTLVWKTDITNEEAVKGFFDAVVSRFGGLDMLVNNAGIMDNFDGVGTASKETWDRVISINVTGAFLCLKAAVNAFESKPEPSGTVINIGSIASYRGVMAGAAYTAAKHALLGLTKNTAGYYGAKGISCIALLLGGMDETNIVDAFARGFNQVGMMLMGAVNPGYVPGKTGVPVADVAKYCLFFSDDSMARASNGASVCVNNNWPAA
ncbi:Uu.00g050450.m01.CDS01 [Anthostomella pinea]|uniref:Uu.00g050450.m01.CDS01 n=1 Tax=Anthostomella pinea TaxID=933095 RepID=A0AAI8VSM8_9PEZI|nr:Uu.00g050450.m01.CDS01 [Anthostomella pinea]